MTYIIISEWVQNSQVIDMKSVLMNTRHVVYKCQKVKCNNQTDLIVFFRSHQHIGIYRVNLSVNLGALTTCPTGRQFKHQFKWIPYPCLFILLDEGY